MNYVLHIGINNYVRYAANGSSNLRGAVNDAGRWRSYTAGALSVHDARARVLTDEAATRDGILDGLKWLREQMAADPDASGLVTYSGHGASLAETGDGNIGLTAALCPFDVAVAGNSLVNLLSLAEVESALGPAAANTTVVVDACYSSVPNAAAPNRALGTGATPPNIHDRVVSRLILGCQPWGQSYEMRSGGNWHGAMTFSMLTLLEQWTVKRSRGAMHANVSYGDLLYRTHQQLGVLGFEQTPLLLGEPRSAMIPFLRPGRDIAAGTTSPVPDLRRPGSQLGAGDGSSGYRIYQLTAYTQGGSGAVVLATMLVPHSASGQVANYWGFVFSFLPGWEYWWWSPTAADSLFDSTGASVVTRIELSLVLDRLTGWDSFGDDSRTYLLIQFENSPSGGRNAPVTVSVAAGYNPMPIQMNPDVSAFSLGVCWASVVPSHVTDSAAAICPVMTGNSGPIVVLDMNYYVGSSSLNPQTGGFFNTMVAGDVIAFTPSGNQPDPSTLEWTANTYYPN